MNTEEWRDIPGFPGYQASSLGRVRSPRKVLSQYLSNRGYFLVTIDGEGNHNRTVHGLVARAFHGEPPEGFEVAHDDGDKANNREGNVLYKTRSLNRWDMDRHGTLPHGERHGMAKLTAADVLMIRQVDHETTSALAKRYGVARSTIKRILARKTWVRT